MHVMFMRFFMALAVLSSATMAFQPAAAQTKADKQTCDNKKNDQLLRMTKVNNLVAKMNQSASEIAKTRQMPDSQIKEMLLKRQLDQQDGLEKQTQTILQEMRDVNAWMQANCS
jgi:hypothetical protein